MSVSVIVPLYNNRAYIGAALDSILGQTRPPDEIVVVDDGSTDGGPDVVAGYRSPVRLLRQDHRGPSSALNHGLRATRGDMVAFLDADDLWLPDKLALQCPVLAGDGSIDGIFGHVVQFLSEDVAAAGDRVAVPSSAVPGTSRATLLMWRHALDRFGWFDESMSTSDFVPWWSRAVALGFRFRMLEDVLAKRRIHRANTGTLRRREQQQESLLGLRRALALRRGGPVRPE